jgi:hypothetical protein
MSSRRNRTWPIIDLYQKDGPGVIKVLGESDLAQLMSKATASRWSAEGRPDWLRKHRGQLKGATLVVFGTEGRGTLRCIATVILADGSGGRFTLDVAVSDYEALDDLDDQAMVEMAHRYLGTFPPVPLDDAQGRTWDSSVWKAWGES